MDFMKKIVCLLFASILLGYAFLFFNNPNNLIAEKKYGTADIVSCRTYSKVSGSAYSTTSREYVEYIFYHDGELKIEKDLVSDIFIGDVSTVGIESSESYSSYRLALTLEDYQKLTRDGFWEPELVIE